MCVLYIVWLLMSSLSLLLLYGGGGGSNGAAVAATSFLTYSIHAHRSVVCLYFYFTLQ